MNDLVSVIVPVYKVEKYLCKCVDSICNQTYQNLEIILVDDGSPDNSGDICDAYAGSDARIRVIHKENGGVSAARNTGIDCATGEYIMFVDGDDWLASDAVEHLIGECKKHDADLMVGSYATIYARREIPSVVKTQEYIGAQIGENFIDLYLLNGANCWNKLYRTSLVLHHKIRFKEQMPLGEDALFSVSYMGICQKICLSSNITYYYNKTVAGSAMTKFYPEYHQYHTYIFEAAKATIQKTVTAKDISKYISTFADYLCCGTLNYYLNNSFITHEMKHKIDDVIDYYYEYLAIDCYAMCGTKVITQQELECLTQRNTQHFLSMWKNRLIKERGWLVIRFYVRLLLRKIGWI